jgi:hypothetical protein
VLGGVSHLAILATKSEFPAKVIPFGFRWNVRTTTAQNQRATSLIALGRQRLQNAKNLEISGFTWKANRGLLPGGTCG